MHAEKRIDLLVPSIDKNRAAAFIGAVPRGRWTSYGDVARAGGSPKGAQAVGGWLRREGDQLPHVYRVLLADGFVADGFRPAGRGVPKDSERVRDILKEEGVVIDDEGRADSHQRFRFEDWH